VSEGSGINIIPRRFYQPTFVHSHPQPPTGGLLRQMLVILAAVRCQHCSSKDEQSRHVCAFCMGRTCASALVSSLRTSDGRASASALRATALYRLHRSSGPFLVAFVLRRKEGQLLGR
jgi:hypothetical protein